MEPRTEDCLTRAGSGSCFGFDLLVWQASNKGVSKGEGKQGKGSGKSVPEKRFAITLNIDVPMLLLARSKDKGKSKGKGRGPRVYGEACGQRCCCGRYRRRKLGGL